MSYKQRRWSNCSERLVTAPLRLPTSDRFTNHLTRSEDVYGQPGLSLFVWEDGAPFEFLMIQEETFEFPLGIDPTNTEIGPSSSNNATLMAGLRPANDSHAQEVSALYL